MKTTTKPAKKNRKRSSRWMWRFTSWSWILVKFSHRAESNGQKLLLADGEYKPMLTLSQCCQLFQTLCLSYRKNNLSLVSIVTAVQWELFYNSKRDMSGWSSTRPLAVMPVPWGHEHTRHTSCVRKLCEWPKGGQEWLTIQQCSFADTSVFLSTFGLTKRTSSLIAKWVLDLSLLISSTSFL